MKRILATETAFEPLTEITTKTTKFSDFSTEVEISVKWLDEDNVMVSARGIAKLNPIDKFDSTLGEHIAWGRAMEKFARKYTRLAVSTAETIGQYKRRIKNGA